MSGWIFGILWCRRVVALCGAFALAACSLPYTEPFISPFDKVSGADGTIWFIHSYKLRNCGWFECGESSTKILGATLTAYRLNVDTTGRLAFTRVAKMTCDEEHADDCDMIATDPVLRLHDGKLEVTKTKSVPNQSVIAWTGMRDFELSPNGWLCTASRMPQDKAARLLKISPNSELTGVGQVLYALSTPPSPEASGLCTPLAALPREQGAPDRLFLGDAVRDAAGRLHVTYLAKKHQHDWDGLVTLFATYDGKWTHRAFAFSEYGDPAPALIMPGFLDSSGTNVILDAEWPGVKVRMYDVVHSQTNTQPVRLLVD